VETCCGWSLLRLPSVRVVFLALEHILVVPASFITTVCCFWNKVIFYSFNFWFATCQAVLGILQLLLSYQCLFSVGKIGFILFVFKISDRKCNVLAEGLNRKLQQLNLTSMRLSSCIKLSKFVFGFVLFGVTGMLFKSAFISRALHMSLISFDLLSCCSSLITSLYKRDCIRRSSS